MSIKRKRVARHILVPDTNILWHNDKSLCVSPEFSLFLENNSGKYQLDLLVPEVVLGELQFQQTASALKALSKANEEFKRMSQIADNKYTHRVAENRVRRDVQNKLETWIQCVNCQPQQTPIDEIDWNELINDSIWRKAPFTEEKNTEKGFRDSLIVQTLGYIVRENPNINIAFISSDRRVREAAVSKHGAEFDTYETLEEFESFLKLTDEELTNEFVRAIQTRAKEKFHAPSDRAGLLYENQLISQIREQFPKQLETPSPPSNAGILGRLSIQSNRWIPKTRESTWVVAPQFVKLDNGNEFYWRSKITFVQFFEYSGASGGTLLTNGVRDGEQRLRKINFPVIWRSKVAKNGRFMSLEFQEFESAETIFTEITQAERDLYEIHESENIVEN